MNKAAAIDTNILIYALDISFPVKKQVSETLIDSLPVISSQSLSEFANVCLRKFKFDKAVTMQIINRMLRKCVLHPSATSTYVLAEKLMAQYQFQLFDAIITASALESGCELLYTEDMHHGLVIEKQLTIYNPFL